MPKSVPDLLLGLIGDNIAASRAPHLHRIAGGLSGLEVRYDRLVPVEMRLDFDEVFAQCVAGGYRGINITYPYKERAAEKVHIDDPLVAAMGAVNTIVFGADGPKGFNTDYSGFVSAYRAEIGDRTAPGSVCMVGAGGVGKAVAFGLIALGLDDIRIVERDLDKAEALAAALRAEKPGLRTYVTDDPAQAVTGANGLINCTPVGMVGYEGTPLPKQHMTDAAWVFDAIYTPIDTQFLQDAAAAGLTTLSGYELFFHQGVDAWRIFSGGPVDHAALRAALEAEPAA
jgi:shikimate dehydrogenase